MSNELRVENLQSPWPESIWTMTEDEYVKAVPDEKLRTAISGFLMREGWVIAKQEILAIVKADDEAEHYDKVLDIKNRPSWKI